MNILDEEFEEWISKQFNNKNKIIVNKDNIVKEIIRGQKLSKYFKIFCICFILIFSIGCMISFGIRLYSVTKNLFVLTIYLITCIGGLELLTEAYIQSKCGDD